MKMIDSKKKNGSLALIAGFFVPLLFR